MSEGRILVLLAIAAAPVAAQQRPCDPPTPLGPSHDLYCIELVPAPGLVGISGRVELGVPPGPFTVAVTPDGRSRYVPIVSLHGLPPQASLVKATSAAYVAWVAPPQMDTVIKLGEVRNGSTALRAVDLDKFVVLITAERDRRAREPTGRVVLRGQSPSTRICSSSRSARWDSRPAWVSTSTGTRTPLEIASSGPWCRCRAGLPCSRRSWRSDRTSRRTGRPGRHRSRVRESRGGSPMVTHSDSRRASCAAASTGRPTRCTVSTVSIRGR